MATADDKMIKIVVKTPQVKETIEINERAKIEEVNFILFLLVFLVCSRKFLLNF